MIARTGTQGLLSPAYLFDDHDGHVMPAAFLLSGAITRVTPFGWIGPAISLVLLQLVASLALLRTLHVVLGWRPVLLVPLIFALFSPLGLPAFAWWAAALNALPMVAAMAWVCADAILLVRTGNQRYAVTGTGVFAVGLLFFEKAAVIPFVAFGVAALLAHVLGERTVVTTVWHAGRRLWIASGALTVAWIGIYFVVVDQRRWTLDLSMTGELLIRSVTHGIVPALVGGPWTWERWAPSSPWALPGIAVMVVGWLGAGRGHRGVLRPQGTDPRAVAGRGGLRPGLPGADLPDAVIAVHRDSNSRRRCGTCPTWPSCWRSWRPSDSAPRTGRTPRGWTRRAGASPWRRRWPRC